MEPRSEDDGDVHVTPAGLQGAVGNGLKAQGSHALPHVEGPPDGVVSLPGAHFWRDIFDALEQQKGRMNNVDEGKTWRWQPSGECTFRGGMRSLPSSWHKIKERLHLTQLFQAQQLLLNFHHTNRYQLLAGREGWQIFLPLHSFSRKKKSGFGIGKGSAQIDILLGEVAHQFGIVEEGGI